MKMYTVRFIFIGGDSHSFDIDTEQYGGIASRITDSRDGWFGVSGDMVNLRNVTRVQIQEKSDPTDAPKHQSQKHKDADAFIQW